MVSNKLRLWEAALFLAFGLTLTVGVWSSASASALAGQVLRLHVVANSDSQQDQALKLQVRDAVLAQASPLLEGATSQAQAEEVLTPQLEELGQPWTGQAARTRSPSAWKTSGSPPRSTTASPCLRAPTGP